MDFSFRRTNTSPRFEELDCGKKALLTWSTCGVLKNTGDQLQHFTIAAFTKINFPNKYYSDKFADLKIPIECLVQIRIQSLFKGNRTIAKVQSDRISKTT